MSKFKKLITPCILLIFGLFIHLLPMILNTDRMPGDLGDARLINYLLEHSFLWLTQNYPHSEFWSPPIFWPLNNTLAFSDILIGEMIIYIPIRFFIKDPFQIFFVITNILNYAVFYIFSRKILKLEVLFASISAFFFAFNLPRYAQSNHIQLLAQFYMILPVMFLCVVERRGENIVRHTTTI